uniref:Uncharacterized protein n=1 Tax=Anguilla anguilla TaxID=7936 RepID=A0A0E9X1K4_ANGAN
MVLIDVEFPGPPVLRSMFSKNIRTVLMNSFSEPSGYFGNAMQILELVVLISFICGTDAKDRMFRVF